MKPVISIDLKNVFGGTGDHKNDDHEKNVLPTIPTIPPVVIPTEPPFPPLSGHGCFDNIIISHIDNFNIACCG